MAVTFFPFNSIVVDGVPDRPAKAENLAAYLAGFFSNGVLMQEDTALKVEAYSGMEVQIQAGMGNINGKTILNDAAEVITLDTASASLARIDRVVFRLDEVNRLMEFDVLTGTPASSPIAPALTQTADVYELCLAEIRVPAGASEILASYISDTRTDAELCGAANVPKHTHNTAEDRQSINFVGYNPITSISEDTPAKWKACGTGFAYIGGAGVLTDSPGNYGVVLNMVYANEVRQIWFGMYNGDIYHRGGHTTSGWSGTWKRMLDEQNMLDMVYPVGAVYISYKSTSPASLFGGTWTAITGRFPYFNAGTETGGSNTHTLTVAQMPSHSHSIGYRSIYAGSGNYLALTAKASETATADSHDTGGGGSHNNMPAYQTLYAWRRTA